MKLPELYQIIIPKKKIIDYLLSLSHTIGKHKARYFYKVGFSVENREQFSDAIIEIVRDINISKQFQNNYGTIFIIEGEMKTPSNTKIKVRTVWIVLTNQNIATLITVYPI